MDTTWRIEIEGPGAEDLAFDSSFSQVARIRGAEVLADHSVRLFVSATEGQRDQLLRLLAEKRFVVRAVDAEESCDWEAAVKNSWVPFSAGSFEVVPVLDEKPPARTPDQKQILLRPGVGFGTGHSQTTQSALLCLDAVAGSTHRPEKIIDIGTGSGVLAIAAAKLFPKSSLHGIDVQEAALENAIGNVALNGLSPRISLTLGDPESAQDAYGLIIANLDIGIHLSILGEYNRLAAPHAQLIVAGVRDSVTAAQFSDLLHNEALTGWDSTHQWQLLHCVESGEWKAFLFTKVE